MAGSKSHAFRFAVGSSTGLRSGVWRLWTNYRGSDVYVSLRISGGLYKASLHGSGDWRIQHSRESNLTTEKGSRVVAQWRRPPEWRPGWTRCFDIFVPRTEVVPPIPLPEKLDKVHWCPIPEGEGDLASVFSVFLASPDVPFDSEWWPGREVNQSVVMTQARLGSGESVWLLRAVHELDDATRDVIESKRIEEAEKFLPTATRLEGDALLGRTILSGLHEGSPEDGASMFVELALQVFRGEQNAQRWFASAGASDWYDQAFSDAPTET
jgi:hypothetical protein